MQDMLSWCSYILLATAIVVFFKYKWKRQKLLKKFKHFHHIPFQPFISHVKYFLNLKERVTIFLKIMKPQRYPAVLWIFNMPLVIVGSGVDIQKVLTESDDKGIYNKAKGVFRSGIIVKTGEEWRKSRRIANQMFSASMMQRYLTAFNQHSAELIRKLETFANTRATFDLRIHLLIANSYINMGNFVDYQSKTLQNDDERFPPLVEKAGDLATLRYTHPLLFFDFMNNAYLYVTGEWKIFHEINERFSNMVRNRIEHYKLNQLHQHDDTQETGKLKQTSLDMMIKAHLTDPDYTFESMKDDLFNIVIAGTGTTSRTICFTLLMLAIHQDAQDKVYEEIKTVLGNTNRPVEMNDMNQLVYLEQCIKETLRKFILLLISFRKHSQDIVLNEKQIIPAHTDIVIALYALHHSENIYPKPDSWDPDRFAPEAVAKRDKLSFLPFGIGPQACIGAKYAMISMKTQLVHLLRSYHFDTDMKLEDIKLSSDVTLKSVNGYNVKIRSRENNHFTDVSIA